VFAFARWDGGEAPVDKTDRGISTYVITRIYKDETKSLEVGKAFTLPRFIKAKRGDTFILMGQKTKKKFDWTTIQCTAACYDYTINVPSGATNELDRLKYFVKYLEYSDKEIASDAFDEIERAPESTLIQIGPHLSRDKLRKWISDPVTDTDITRIGTYGTLLGLCGNADDAEFLLRKILFFEEDFQLETKEFMIGYLLLTREKGLQVIVDEVINEAKAPFHKCFAAMQAMRFMKRNGKGLISDQQLFKAMERFLDHEKLADLVIVDLARWEDWSIIDRLYNSYDQPGINTPSTKRAIIRYLLIAKKHSEKTGQSPDLLKKANLYFAALEKRDPKNVQKVLRYFFD